MTVTQYVSTQLKYCQVCIENPEVKLFNALQLTGGFSNAENLTLNIALHILQQKCPVAVFSVLEYFWYSSEHCCFWVTRFV